MTVGHPIPPVIMPADVALGVVRRVRVLEQNVQYLQKRLADREHLLALALHELALLRDVRDPQYFMRVRTHRALRGRKRIGPVAEAEHVLSSAEGQTNGGVA